MKTTEPHIVAKWILENIRFENSSEAMIGDLLETFRTQTRSRAWYRRQVLMTVVSGFLSELRNHWVLALRAVGIGLEVSYLAHMLGHEFFFRLHNLLAPVISPNAAWIIVSVFCGLVSGWVVGLFHRRHQNAMLLVFVGSLLIWESVARFYISSFVFSQDLVYALMFYPSAVLGVFFAVLLLSFSFGSRSKEMKSTAR